MTYVELRNPVMTASGTFGYGEEYADFIDDNESLSDDNYVTSERQVITLSVANCELELKKQ